MTDAVKARREFVQDLAEKPLVDDLDFTRDGYRTVVLKLGTPAEDSSMVCERRAER